MGTGYIGSVVVARFVNAGHDVEVYDNLSKGSERAVPKGAALVAGDVSDRARLRQRLKAYVVVEIPRFWLPVPRKSGES